jgi:hypothetical protein
LHLISGHILKDTDVIGKMDPYVLVNVGNTKVKSNTHENGGT